jgi:hypothetical protein
MNPKSQQTPENNGAKPSAGGIPTTAAAELQHGLVAGAHDVSDGVKHLAQDVAGQAKKTAETALASRKDVAVEGVRSVAQALRQTSEHLRSENQGPLPDFVSQAADRVEQVSSYLQSRTLGQVLGDVESFARREPALFLGGAFVGGLVGGRFLKSSAPARAYSPPTPNGGQRPRLPERSFEERDTVPGAGVQGRTFAHRPAPVAKPSSYSTPGSVSTSSGSSVPAHGTGASSAPSTTSGTGTNGGTTGSSNDHARGRL